MSDVFKNCRGERKKELVKQYEITPILRTKLLKGQSKDGCCGELTDVYYVFKYKENGGSSEGSFYVGDDCGKQFLDLIGKKELPFLFNPLKEMSSGGGGSQGNAGSPTDEKKQFNPLNSELICAIGLLIAAWNKPLNGLALSIFEFTKLFPEKPNVRGVENFNNHILSKDYHKRSLMSIYESLKKENNLKEFTFERMHNHLIEQGIKSYIK
jgi:hypothetical protein